MQVIVDRLPTKPEQCLFSVETQDNTLGNYAFNKYICCMFREGNESKRHADPHSYECFVSQKGRFCPYLFSMT